MFTGITLLLNIFTVDTGVKYFVLSFTYIPLFFAGVMINPVVGFLVGFLADLLGSFIHPLGPYNPLIGIASGLLGLIPGLISKIKPLNDYVKAIISFVLMLVICTCGLNTYALFLMYSKGKTFWAYLGVRFPFQVVVASINMVAVLALLKPMRVIQRKVLHQL